MSNREVSGQQQLTPALMARTESFESDQMISEKKNKICTHMWLDFSVASEEWD